MSLATYLQELIEAEIAPERTAHPIFNLGLRISRGRIQDEAPEILFEGAAGMASPGVPMTPGHKFRTASISKTMTARLILAECHRGKLSLDMPILSLLPPLPGIDWKALSIFENRPQAEHINLLHLLNHRSGLADYVFGDPRFMRQVMVNPGLTWDPQLILEKYYAWDLPHKAKGEPGKVYHYTDTNYLLLGLIIENLSDKSLADNYIEELFKPLDLPETYLECHGPQRGTAPLSYPFHQHHSTVGFNFSFGFGGGGVVSTLRDLDLFFRHFGAGSFVPDLGPIQDWPHFEPEHNRHHAMGTDGSDYGLGIRRLHFQDREYYGHTGSWGCASFLEPVSGLNFVLTLNQNDHGGRLGRLFKKITTETFARL